MKNLTIITWLCLLTLTINAFGQKTKKTVSKFSSQYSNLNSDCKTLGGGSEGTDESSDCKGVGGYRVYVGAAAALVHIAVQAPDKKDLIQLATQDFDFEESKVKIEWRMTGGKPFAVIMRVSVYAEEVAEGAYFGKKTGEVLIVRGLRGFDYIDFEVDAKTPDANRKARKSADKAYSEKNSK